MSAGEPESLRERNRELIAERLGYPAGTVEDCREIERRCPGFTAWYAVGDLSTPEGARYGARAEHARHCDPTYYGETPDQIIAQIEAGSRP